ncbi:MAG: sigma-70 family RNA polymerase sigma factor [Phycisphaerales bacterium]|nr:sigma-70 family RNA polymerase sigma factor [Phycisphaerales bacterium]
MQDTTANPPPSSPDGSQTPSCPEQTGDEHVTRLLSEAAAGGTNAARELLPLVYRSLREIARRQIGPTHRSHTIQATALVHEAYLRLVGRELAWADRAHFYAAAAEAMRHVLIDYARRAGAKKRGGGLRREISNVVDLASDESISEAIEIDDAIEALRQHDPRAASVVHLRFYTGLSIDQTASALGLAPATVDREWRYARAWLHRRLGIGDEPEPQR